MSGMLIDGRCSGGPIVPRDANVAVSEAVNFDRNKTHFHVGRMQANPVGIAPADGWFLIAEHGRWNN